MSRVRVQVEIQFYVARSIHRKIVPISRSDSVAGKRINGMETKFLIWHVSHDRVRWVRSQDAVEVVKGRRWGWLLVLLALQREAR